MMYKAVSYRKAPRRTIAVATTVLFLVASLIILGASPAAALGIGAGEFTNQIVYSPALSLDPLTAPQTSWTASSFPSNSNPTTPSNLGTFSVDGHMWVGAFDANFQGSSDFSGENFYGGNGAINSFVVQEIGVTGEYLDVSGSGSYSRIGPIMTMNISGNASVYDSGSNLIASGPFSMTVTSHYSFICSLSCLESYYTQTDNSGSLPDLGWVPIPDDLEVIREVPSFFDKRSNDCDAGQQISDNTTQGAHSKLYVRQPTPDSLDVCVRVELVPSGEGYGGKLSITPTGLAPGVGDPLLPSQDANSTACTSTTPNQVPGNHPITAGGLGGVDYMVDAYADGSEAWLCLYVESTPPTNLRVKVPLGNSVPPVTYGYAATWYPDPGTP